MKGSVALVTGAASGLGWALCQELAAGGHGLVMVDKDASLLQAKAALIPADQRLLITACDLSHRPDITALAQKLQALPGLDYLINNAGITHRSLAAKTDPRVIAQVMAVDFQAPVELALICLPLLKRRSGQIVNIGSMAGWMPVLGRAGYCAAKSALHQYFEVMRAEIEHTGVNILMVYPSFLNTAIEKNALDANGMPNARARSTIGRTRSAEWMAKKIVQALLARKQRLFPDKFTYWASVLYKLLPGVYLATMRKKFAVELEAKVGG